MALAKQSGQLPASRRAALRDTGSDGSLSSVPSPGSTPRRARASTGSLPPTASASSTSGRSQADCPMEAQGIRVADVLHAAQESMQAEKDDRARMESMLRAEITRLAVRDSESRAQFLSLQTIAAQTVQQQSERAVRGRYWSKLLAARRRKRNDAVLHTDAGKVLRSVARYARRRPGRSLALASVLPICFLALAASALLALPAVGGLATAAVVRAALSSLRRGLRNRLREVLAEDSDEDRR
eukprot:TRINITY_DN11974_c0_g1_i1.p2 TRINITY_DN11974_c0_g1~~TRINITY_DN11974_c0_g1_i1.p2  ORF type:complete len:261 (+),score=78.07 TRINITY_DN11974_c0_g1_i1:63-785(+)